MEFKEIKNKKEYLEKNYPFYPVPELNEKRNCMHCGKDIVVGDYKVKIKKRDEFIVCPNAPECDGDVSDWIDSED